MTKKTPKSPALTRAQQKRQQGKAEKAAQKEHLTVNATVLPPLEDIPIDKSDRSGATSGTEDE